MQRLSAIDDTGIAIMALWLSALTQIHKRHEKVILRYAVCVSKWRHIFYSTIHNRAYT